MSKSPKKIRYYKKPCASAQGFSTIEDEQTIKIKRPRSKLQQKRLKAAEKFCTITENIKPQKETKESTNITQQSKKDLLEYKNTRIKSGEKTIGLSKKTKGRRILHEQNSVFDD